MTDNFLGSIPIFQSLKPEEISFVIKEKKSEIIKQDEFLVKEGETPDYMIVIKSGEAQVYAEIEGEIEEIATLSEGAICCEMSIISGKPAGANIKAISDVEIYKIPKSVIYKLTTLNASFKETLTKLALERSEENILFHQL